MKASRTIWELLNAFGMMVVASILWGFCCLPIITIGPASTALYYTIVKVIRRDRDTVFSAYFNSFKENFWQGFRLNLIFLFYFAILALVCLMHLPEDWARTHSPNAVMYVCCGFMLLAIWMLPYIYPVLSRFRYSVSQVFRFVLYIGVRNFHCTILLVALLLITVVFSILRPVFLIITPALYTLASSFLLEPIFRKCSLRDGSENYEMWYGKTSWSERIDAVPDPDAEKKSDF